MELRMLSSISLIEKNTHIPSKLLVDELEMGDNLHILN